MVSIVNRSIIIHNIHVLVVKEYQFTTEKVFVALGEHILDNLFLCGIRRRVSVELTQRISRLDFANNFTSLSCNNNNVSIIE